MLAHDDPRAVALTAEVHRGNVSAIVAMLQKDPALAVERFGDTVESRTALHIATDWPGHFPHVGATIAALVAAGAPVDGRHSGRHTETALHWAASSDDVEALDALLDAGANIEADGAVHTGGTPLSDAVVFAQWHAARRLVARGAVMTIWQAAALGDTAEVLRQLEATTVTRAELDNACWNACRAGELSTARQLVDRGADVDWLGHDELTSRAAGVASGRDDLIAWLLTQH
jgi:uncharacterized protein